MQFYSNVKVYNNVKRLPKHARIICVFVSCVSHVFVPVHCCFVVTCWERADLWALVGDVYCNLFFIFFTWYPGSSEVLDRIVS